VYNESIQELINGALIMYPGVKMISGIEVTLSEMKNIIICVATGTALAPLKSVENKTSRTTTKTQENGRQQTRRRRTMPRVNNSS
jgi:predicted ribosome-associated RNA-binding protein Tma20